MKSEYFLNSYQISANKYIIDVTVNYTCYLLYNIISMLKFELLRISNRNMIWNRNRD